MVRSLSIEAAGFAADYLAEVHLKKIYQYDLQIVEDTGHLVVDQTTLRNLETLVRYLAIMRVV